MDRKALLEEVDRELGYLKETFGRIRRRRYLAELRAVLANAPDDKTVAAIQARHFGLSRSGEPSSPEIFPENAKPFVVWSGDRAHDLFETDKPAARLRDVLDMCDEGEIDAVALAAALAARSQDPHAKACGRCGGTGRSVVPAAAITSAQRAYAEKMWDGVRAMTPEQRAQPQEPPDRHEWNVGRTRKTASSVWYPRRLVASATIEFFHFSTDRTVIERILVDGKIVLEGMPFAMLKGMKIEIGRVDRLVQIDLHGAGGPLGDEAYAYPPRAIVEFA